MHTGGVDARYLGIGLVLVIGIAVVIYGWLADRVDTKRRQAALEQTPDRPIPGLKPDAPTPAYVSSPQALQPRPRTVLTDQARTSLQARLNGAPSLAYGHAAPEFATDADSGLCILEQPWILVAIEAVDSIREVLPFLQKASAAGHKVVLVAPAIDEAVLGTLRVNAMSGTLANAAVLLPSWISGGSCRLWWGLIRCLDRICRLGMCRRPPLGLVGRGSAAISGCGSCGIDPSSGSGVVGESSGIVAAPFVTLRSLRSRSSSGTVLTLSFAKLLRDPS